MDRVTDYAEKVVSGEIISGKYAKLACKRHLDDLKRQGSEQFPYIFNIEKAEHVISFFSYLKHIEGPFAGKSIELAGFQCFIEGSLFGWIHKGTGFRRFRKAYVQEARKQGKSMQLAGTGLYMLVAEKPKEIGGQVFATASKKEQARIVFEAAQQMSRMSPELLERLKVMRDGIYNKGINSKFVPLSKDTKSLDGFNPYLGILDEYHAHPTSEMYDVLISGMGQRNQPLLFSITTAGFSINSPCFKEYVYCTKILEGSLENEQYFVYIAQLDKDDNYKDERNWIKSNPILTTTPKVYEFLRQELQSALDNPDKMRNFLTKNMNVWMDQKENGFLAMDHWNQCYEPNWPDLMNKECWCGVDLSADLDLTSVTFEFRIDDVFFLYSHSFIPSETLEVKRKTDKVPYDAWIKMGWITEILGGTIDDDVIEDYIIQEQKEMNWKIKEICYDKWSARQLVKDMSELRFKMVEIPQTIKYMNAATKDFRALVIKRQIRHCNDPVLTWAMSNAVVKEDTLGNVMLDKAKASERIDPVAATLNAHYRCMTNEDNRSVYERRGMRSLM
jgi:phage terminase large subunit-like protein